MIFSTILSVFVISVANGLKTCDDCIKINECPQAIQQMNDDSNEDFEIKLREASCGGDSMNFKVCCSDFSNTNIPTETNNEDEIENHPNLHLLSEECGVMQGDRIIGGRTASLYEFPWLVLISHKKDGKSEFGCGGTLINTRYVLTAAHCMRGHTIASVRVGEYKISTTNDCYGIGKWRQCESRIQDMSVSHTIIHPAYRRVPIVINDIGLLRLKSHVDFSAKNAGAICLPVFQNLREDDISGVTGIVAGWGKTETERSSDILLKVDIPIHSSEPCRIAFRGKIKPSLMNRQFETTLCAGESGADSCQGDSGGPLMVDGEYNDTYRYIQYGVVSYGIDCGTDIPAIYTDVRKYMKWILDTIKP